MRTPGSIRGRDAEVPVFAHHRLHPFILAEIEAIVLGDFAVILERLFTVRLLLGGRERNISDLEQLRRGEEHHVRRIVEERIYQASFVQDDDLEANLLRFYGAGEPRWPRSDYEHIATHFRARFGLGLRLGFDYFGCEKVRHGDYYGVTRCDEGSSGTRKPRF